MTYQKKSVCVCVCVFVIVCVWGWGIKESGSNHSEADPHKTWGASWRGEKGIGWWRGGPPALQLSAAALRINLLPLRRCPCASFETSH